MMAVGISGVSLAHAETYTHQIYLCDMGMMNPGTTGSRGVDYMEYMQNGRKETVLATPAWSSAAVIAGQKILGFDRWNSAYAINDVGFNLESDFYGSQYYLEYCYMWDRDPHAPGTPGGGNYTIQYSFVVSAEIPVQIINTAINMNSKCDVQNKNHKVRSSEFLQTPLFQELLEPDEVSMRCTIRLTFKEETVGLLLRPHNNVVDGAVQPETLDPQIKIKVTP